MAAAASNSLAAATVFMQRLPATTRAVVFCPLRVRPSLYSTTFKVVHIANSTFLTGFFLGIYPSHQVTVPEKGRSSQLIMKASSSEESSLDVNELFTDLKEKWDGLENKSTVLLYGGGAVVGIWLASIVVSAVNSVPLLPKLMELVGLGYTGWFVYRYLLFKSSRKELVTDIEELKKKVSGEE